MEKPKEEHHFGVNDHDVQFTVMVRLLECAICVYISFATIDEGEGQ